MEKNMFSDESRDAAEVLKFLIKNGRTILTALISSVILTIICTFLIPKEYSSSATVFPTNVNTLDLTIDNPQFGYDVEADRLIQLMSSKEVKDSIVKNFDMINYYELDTGKKTWADDLKKRYYSDIQFNRTPSMSVIVAAQTKNPELSANIANKIVSLADGVRTRILKQNIYTAYTSLEKEYNQQKNIVDTIVKKIFEMKNIIKNSSLVLLINQHYNINLEKMSGEFQNSTYLEQAINEYNFEQTKLNDIRTRYDKAKTTYNRPLPSIYIVEKAIPLYKKVFPSYLINLSIVSIFILFSTVAVLFLKQKFASSKI